MIGGLQGDFGDLDNKYLKQNISRCRSEISGSFGRTPRHCILWENSPGKRNQKIRICLTREVETSSSPIRMWNVGGRNFGCEISQGGPSACARCRDLSPGWHGVRKAIRISPRGHVARSPVRTPSGRSTRHSWTSHPDDSIPYPDMLSESLTKVSKSCYSPRSTAILFGRPV